MNSPAADVVVIGAGNAACCAALAARERGAEVLVLERAPADCNGGNSRFTAGAMRVVYDGVDDITTLVPDLTDEERRTTDFGAYRRADFLDDLGRLTDYRCDPALAETLVDRSFDTLNWMRGHGVRFQPIYGRQAFQIDGRFRFWGGLTLEAWGGGPGLVDALHAALAVNGVRVLHNADAFSLERDDQGVSTVHARVDGRAVAIRTGAVVLACGGFQANAAWRAQYLGPGWELARVRGTAFNTGDGIRMALAVGAATRGNWSGCHAVGWDLNAPEFGDLAVGDGFQKHSYPFGILVNARGERFVDEGADFRNYTYARYGREILAQPGHFAWQVFDDKVAHLLRDEYRIRTVTKVSSPTLAELAGKLDGVAADGFLATVKAFNAAVDTDTPFNPNVLDGRAARGLAVPKSHWANRLDAPPFTAYAVTCGITFTFGGLHIDARAAVIGTNGVAVPGLFAAGEITGGLFYGNYPGGSGLTNGAVFGRLAGAGAAAFARAVAA